MKLLKRFSIAILFALFVTAATYMIAQGKTGDKRTCSQQPPNKSHAAHVTRHSLMRLQSGVHGHATSDPLFTQMWTDQGKPGACLVCHVTGYDPASGTWKEDGVSCEACHGPVPAAHSTDPIDNPVPVDRTSDLCGRCHSGDRFNIADWQIQYAFPAGNDLYSLP